MTFLARLFSFFVFFLFSLSNTFANTAPSEQAEKIDSLTVYTAKRIITMEPSMPEAKAVAVANGKIVSVGTLDSLKVWTDKYETQFDKSLKDKILMPGFVDPHLHPTLPATLTLFSFLAPDDWSIPTGDFPGALTHEAYVEALKVQVANYPNSPYYQEDIPFVSWGFHPLWHGDVFRPKLDELFPNTPVILWHRSFHELIANTKAIEMLGISEEESKEYPRDIKWDKGLFSEFGAKKVFMPKLMAVALTPERYATGMGHFAEMLHMGGVTSAMDMGIGIFGDPEGEIAMITQAFEENDTPARIILTPLITDFIARGVSPTKALKQVKAWEKDNSGRVQLDGHFKLMMDGAAFSGLGQMDFPGYLDGHEGIWMSPLETTYEYAKVFWDAGYQLHAHTNGDKSAGALISMIASLQKRTPRVDHRTTLEHFMYAREGQLERMAELGIAVSANTFYQYLLADIYAENWLGEDRARNMVPLGAAIRAGVPVAFHSDAPMAPLSPLTLAWAAVNRDTINGEQNNKAQAVTVDEAMRAITINAAWMMRKENEIGSIVAGKKADFTVLEADPYKVSKKNLKDIKVWGTVFEGKIYPVTNSDSSKKSE